MTAVTDLTVTIESTEINSYAWNIGMGGWRFRTASKRGSNPVVAYRDGRTFVGKYFEERTLSLPMWVIGADPDDGIVPVDPGARDQLFENLRALQRLFSTDKATKTMTIYDPYLNKTVEGEIEVIDVIDFSTMAGLTRAVFMPTIVLPGVWWRDVTALYDVATLTTRADLDTWVATVDTDVEISDPTITIQGLAGGTTSPKILNMSDSSHFVQYLGEIANGETLIISCGSYSATLEGSDASNLLAWGTGRREMFVLKNGTNTLKYNGVGADDAKVRVTWKGCYW